MGIVTSKLEWQKKLVQTKNTMRLKGEDLIAGYLLQIVCSCIAGCLQICTEIPRIEHETDRPTKQRTD